MSLQWMQIGNLEFMDCQRKLKDHIFYNNKEQYYLILTSSSNMWGTKSSFVRKYVS